ncbi:hypothetical protein LQT98_13230, partial [Chromobacterium aquaticum]|uniref:hypothetical protein n=1 Tax=Chromobacterium aquaticum TaxID=467180 RepID=UPI001E49BF1C
GGQGHAETGFAKKEAIVRVSRLLRAIIADGRRRAVSEPVQSLLRFSDTALKPSSKCPCTTCTFRFFARSRLVSLLLARL